MRDRRTGIIETDHEVVALLDVAVVLIDRILDVPGDSIRRDPVDHLVVAGKHLEVLIPINNRSRSVGVAVREQVRDIGPGIPLIDAVLGAAGNQEEREQNQG